MRCVEYAPGREMCFGLCMPGFEPFPEGTEGNECRLQFTEDMLREFFVLFSVILYLIKDGRFDVRDNEPVEVVEKGSLDELSAQSGALFGAQLPGHLVPEQGGYDHLVPLLVNFQEIPGSQFVIPAQEIGS